jgi:MoaA/NifB/PqqE/SkfB family radical SAM enzyme
MNAMQDMKVKFMKKYSERILYAMPYQLLAMKIPKRLTIEPTNYCNLKCSLCPTNTTMDRQRGGMTLENFKFIVDSMHPKTTHIDLFLAGEPLLNSLWAKMTRYAADKGKKVMISTNATFLDKYIDDVFSSGLDKLMLAIDGATEETYLKYRVNGDFDRSIAAIKKLCDRKKELNAVKPDLVLQFIVMRHNEHEIPAIMQLGKELGVDRVELKSVSLNSLKSEDEKMKIQDDWLPVNEEYSRYTVEGSSIKIKHDPNYCYWIWSSVIHWNGNVTTCCYDFNGDHTFMNVFKMGGYQKTWKIKEYGKVRRAMLKRELKLCKTCNISDGYYTKVVEFNKPKEIVIEERPRKFAEKMLSLLF